MKTTPLGAGTVELLKGLPQSQAGWLIQAILNARDGNPPTEIPPENLGAWIAAKGEADRIAARAANSKGHGAPLGNRNAAKSNEPEPNQTKSNEIKRNVQIEIESKRESKREIVSTCSGEHVLRAREASKPTPPAITGFEDLYGSADKELRSLLPERVLKVLPRIYEKAKERGLTGRDLCEWAGYWGQYGWKSRGKEIVGFVASVNQWAHHKKQFEERDNASNRRNGGGSGSLFDPRRPMSVQGGGPVDPNDPINTGEPLPF